MLKTTTTNKYKHKVYVYLLGAYTSKLVGYSLDPENMTNAEKVKEVMKIFESECMYDSKCVYESNIQRDQTRQEVLRQWLMGVSLNIAVYYGEIIEQIEEWQEAPIPHGKEDVYLDNWFNFIAKKMIQLEADAKYLAA